MSDIRELLKAKGISCEGMDDETVRKVAKAVGFQVAPKAAQHKVEVVEYTKKDTTLANRYVKTSGFVVGTTPEGKVETAQGLFLRIEAIDQAIADLQAAKGLLGK